MKANKKKTLWGNRAPFKPSVEKGLFNHGFEWGSICRSLSRSFVARPSRVLAQSATVTIPAAVPQTRHWCALTAIIDQFGRELHMSNVADLKLLLGLKSWKRLLLQSMSAVEHKVDNTKQLFVPGSASNYPFKQLVGFVSDLKSTVDLVLLVACHNDTPASAALITQRGGHSAVGKALQPFRKHLPAFVQKHRAVIFASGRVSRAVDWEMQIVRLLEELRPCRIFSELDFTSIESDLVWVSRLDHSIVIEKKRPTIAQLDYAFNASTASALSFLPETSFKAPPLPGWLVGCDPASKSNLSVFALAEFMIGRTRDINDFFCLQQRKVLSEGDDDEDLYGDMPVPQRAIEYSWGSATHAWKATCLPSLFCRKGNPQGISKLDVFCLHTRVSSRGGNTNASHYRSELVSMVTCAKEAHVERMVKSGIPLPMVAHLFPDDSSFTTTVVASAATA